MLDVSFGCFRYSFQHLHVPLPLTKKRYRRTFIFLQWTGNSNFFKNQNHPKLYSRLWRQQHFQKISLLRRLGWANMGVLSNFSIMLMVLPRNFENMVLLAVNSDKHFINIAYHLDYLQREHQQREESRVYARWPVHSGNHFQHPTTGTRLYSKYGTRLPQHWHLGKFHELMKRSLDAF